ncbi:MAG: RNA ligase family protein [Myxococcota bacterium]
MTIKFEALNLDILNSLTKYPSIPTFHQLDPKRGGLLAQPPVMGGPALLTEKVDGTNSRVICTTAGQYLIGSRGELLHGRGDLVANPALGIVETVRAFAERAVQASLPAPLTIFYGEVYGGKVTSASKQYTANRQLGFRLFDVQVIEEPSGFVESSKEAISKWREGGGPTFLHERLLQQYASLLDVELTPRIGEVEVLPAELDQTFEFLQARIGSTQCALDDGGLGAPEGLVVRKADRSQIAKMRFADYRRTFKQRR